MNWATTNFAQSPNPRGDRMKTLLFHSVSIVLIVLGLTASNAANVALQLDGKTYIEVPDSESLNPKKALTIEAWMKMESNGANA